MLSVDVLYLTANNRSTNIVYFNETQLINETISSVLNKLCLEELTTLKGRIDATREIYNIYKFIPIYLNQDVIFQPLYPKRSWNQTFINICNIKKIKEKNKQTLIVFKNKKELIVEIPYLKFKQYLEKCIFIQKDQSKKITERKIILWQRKTLET